MPRCACGSLQRHQQREREMVDAIDVDAALVFMLEHGTAKIDINTPTEALLWRSCVTYGLHRKRAEHGRLIRDRVKSRQFLQEWAANIHAAKAETVAKQAERALR